MSAPMSDAFVMLAQTKDGMGCFLVPRLLEDGSANGLEFQRLKDKLGNRSNASSEVEFSETFGFLLGTPGDGVRTILDMVTLTRLDCALSSAGMMRASMAEAVHHVRGRAVFGKNLIDQPITNLRAEVIGQEHFGGQRKKRRVDIRMIAGIHQFHSGVFKPLPLVEQLQHQGKQGAVEDVHVQPLKPFALQ